MAGMFPKYHQQSHLHNEANKAEYSIQNSDPGDKQPDSVMKTCKVEHQLAYPPRSCHDKEADDRHDYQ
jgi:hypothetical protein